MNTFFWVKFTTSWEPLFCQIHHLMGASVLSNSSPHGSLCFVKFTTSWEPLFCQIHHLMGASVLSNSSHGNLCFVNFITSWEPLFCQIHHLTGASVLSNSSPHRSLCFVKFINSCEPICFFSAKHATLRRKGKDWLARNQNNVSEWSNMSTRGLFFQ
jgi:hypothetical protein